MILLLRFIFEISEVFGSRPMIYKQSVIIPKILTGYYQPDLMVTVLVILILAVNL